MLILFILILSVLNLILICKVFKIFTEITNNQNDLLYILRNDINQLKFDMNKTRDDGR